MVPEKDDQGDEDHQEQYHFDGADTAFVGKLAAQSAATQGTGEKPGDVCESVAQKITSFRVRMGTGPGIKTVTTV